MGCPCRQVGVDDVIRYFIHDCVVTVTEGPESAVVNKKGVPVGVYGKGRSLPTIG